MYLLRVTMGDQILPYIVINASIKMLARTVEKISIGGALAIDGCSYTLSHPFTFLKNLEHKCARASRY